MGRPRARAPLVAEVLGGESGGLRAPRKPRLTGSGPAAVVGRDQPVRRPGALGWAARGGVRRKYMQWCVSCIADRNCLNYVWGKGASWPPFFLAVLKAVLRHSCSDSPARITGALLPGTARTWLPRRFKQLREGRGGAVGRSL